MLMLGWGLLLPLNYTELGLDAVFGLAFLSNIKFWRKRGTLTLRHTTDGCCTPGRWR
jgi:hypothetical protein